mmetsp:Transcript_56171/g.105829  ORF Transcript_56171/g.105829 Transcript_56171/m.105829 type:complete len:108 (-) Transcript_56171:24-347(-)
MRTAGWNVSFPSASSLCVSSGLKFQISKKLARPAQRSGCGCSAHLKKKALSLPRQTAYSVDWFNESRRTAATMSDSSYDAELAAAARAVHEALHLYTKIAISSFLKN